MHLESPYARVGAKLVDMGYSAVPCMPGSKFPGDYSQRRWHAKLGWNQYCDRQPTEYETPIWERWPDAGVCVALDRTVKVIDIDTDDPAVRAAIISVLPNSPVQKRGSKGFSIFYRGSPSIEPRSFNVGGERALDLLAYGKQTVVPPTVHPTTGRPYEWVGDAKNGLLDVAPEDLPELPDDIVQKLAAALEPFGYVAPIERDAVYGDADTAWREVNNIALSRLGDWVPDLGLPRLKRSGSGYRAVAGFRPSGSGKSTEKRNLHLSLHPDGIVDYGDDDRTYTPIDIVMVQSSCDFADAFEWLRDKLGLRPPEIDVSNLVANGLRKTAASVDAEQSPPPETPLMLPDIPDEPEPDIAPAQHPLRAPAGAVDPFEFRTHGGVLGAISKWMYDSAWRPIPEFATIGAIGVCAALFGRRYATPTGLGLNLYLIGIGGSGFGKDHTLKTTQALLTDAGMGFLIGPGDFTSDSAIEHIIRQRPCFVMPMDEFGVFLQATNGRNASGHERRIRKLLLDIATKSDGMWTGKQKVPQQGSKTVVDTAAEPIYNPTVSLIGMSTPSEFYGGISEQNLKDGFVGRMTVFAAARRPKPRDERVPILPPPSLVQEVKRCGTLWPGGSGNLTGNNWRTPTSRPKIHAVPWESEAARLKWRSIEDWQLAVIDDDESKDGIVSRAAEQTLKLATIRACSRNPADPAVTIDDVEWGWAIVSASLWNIDAGVSKHMVSSEFERLCKDIIAHLEQAGGSLPKSVLLRKRGMSKEPRLIKAALEHLAETGQIYPVATTPGRSRPVTLTRE